MFPCLDVMWMLVIDYRAQESGILAGIVVGAGEVAQSGQVSVQRLCPTSVCASHTSTAPHRTAHIAPRPCPYCIARASHSFMGVGTNNVYAGFYADIALVLVLGCVVCGAAL